MLLSEILKDYSVISAKINILRETQKILDLPPIENANESHINDMSTPLLSRAGSMEYKVKIGYMGGTIPKRD